MTEDGSAAGRDGPLKWLRRRDHPRPIPPTNAAHASRTYDYLLGGKNNYGADRELMEKNLLIQPDVQVHVRAQRLFLSRAVEFLVGEAGIRQILDIGSGMPMPVLNNVHEIAQRIAPQTRVVYVDNNAVAVRHTQALLATNSMTVALDGDLREPDAIINHPVTQATLDLTQPVGVLLVGILHFISDEADPAGNVARLRDAVAPGSYVVLNQVSADIDPRIREVTRLFELERANTPLVQRSRAQFESFFDGFELVEPGVVPVNQWRPDGPVRDTCDAFGAVARKM
jgi:S-adenosyl methyltransferase